jgi:hypothetical protein
MWRHRTYTIDSPARENSCLTLMRPESNHSMEAPVGWTRSEIKVDDVCVYTLPLAMGFEFTRPAKNALDGRPA